MRRASRANRAQLGRDRLQILRACRIGERGDQGRAAGRASEQRGPHGLQVGAADAQARERAAQIGRDAAAAHGGLQGGHVGGAGDHLDGTRRAQRRGSARAQRRDAAQRPRRAVREARGGEHLSACRLEVVPAVRASRPRQRRAGGDRQREPLHLGAEQRLERLCRARVEADARRDLRRRRPSRSDPAPVALVDAGLLERRGRDRALRVDRGQREKRAVDRVRRRGDSGDAQRERAAAGATVCGSRLAGGVSEARERVPQAGKLLRRRGLDARRARPALGARRAASRAARPAVVAHAVEAVVMPAQAALRKARLSAQETQADAFLTLRAAVAAARRLAVARAELGPALLSRRIAAPAARGLRLPGGHAPVRDGHALRAEQRVATGVARRRRVEAHRIGVRADRRCLAHAPRIGAGDGTVLVAAARQVVRHADPPHQPVSGRARALLRPAAGALARRTCPRGPQE